MTPRKPAPKPKRKAAKRWTTKVGHDGWTIVLAFDGIEVDQYEVVRLLNAARVTLPSGRR